MTREGNWVYKKIDECPGDLFLSDIDGTRRVLERCKVKQGKEALEAKSRQDGVESDNLEWFRGKTGM